MQMNTLIDHAEVMWTPPKITILDRYIAKFDSKDDSLVICISGDNLHVNKLVLYL